MDQPSMRELVDAVREFIETKAMPELKGHTAFHARVAANALAIVVRELDQGPAAGHEEVARLRGLLAQDGTLEAAIKMASERARPGDVVLLAPACSSFDQFENYEERGRTFKELVAQLKERSGPASPGPQGERTGDATQSAA